MAVLTSGSRRAIIVAVIVLIALVAALLAWNAFTGDGDEESGNSEVLITEQVTQRTLRDEVTIRGELRRDELQAVAASSAGNIGVVNVADGANVSPGDVLFSLDGRNAVAVNADFPFYRTLRVGDEGPDVEQLENILAAGGYDVGIIDTVFTDSTLDGLDAWQRDQRYGSTTTEVAETVAVSLSPGTGYTVGAQSGTSVIIGGNERSLPGSLTSRTPDFEPRQPIDGTDAGGVVGRSAFAQATPPEITITTNDQTVAEGGTATIRFEVDTQFTAATTVSIAVAGTATPTTDYTAPGATFVFPANTSVFDLPIATLTDAVIEADETISVSLVPSSAGLYTIGPLSSSTITISGDTDRPELTVASTSAITPEGQLATFVVTADRVAATAYDIDYSLAGTATAGVDFTIPTGTATMPPGQTSLTIAVQSRQDTEIETDETLVLSLQPSADYLLTAATAETTIVDDDVPVLTLRGRQTLREGKSATFHIRSDQPLTEPMTVSLQVGGTALPGDDYLALANPVVLPVGTDDFEFTVTTIADSITEGNEEVIVSLAPSSGSYRLGSLTTSRLIIEDRASLIGGGTPVVELSSDSATVFEGQPAVFTVRVHSESADPIDVFYTFAGSAVAGDDYSTTTGRVTIQPGQLSAQIPVQTRQDDTVEGDKTLTLRLAAGADYAVGEWNSASTTIESEDVPELTITGGGTIDEGDSATFVITADQAPVENTSVSYQLVGSASPGVDYTPLPGTALLAAGQRSLTVSLTTLNDDVVFLPTDMVVGDWPARIGNVSVDDGDLLQPGQPILSLTSADFTVKLLVSATERSKLAVGQIVEVNLEAGDQVSPGVITELDENPTVDQAGGETYEGFVAVDNEFAAVDGAVVTIDVVLEERLDAVVVPIAAVSQGGTGVDQVRVVNPDTGRVSRVEVETGLIDGAFVEIVRGLDGDELIVVRVDS